MDELISCVEDIIRCQVPEDVVEQFRGQLLVNVFCYIYCCSNFIHTLFHVVSLVWFNFLFIVLYNIHLTCVLFLCLSCLCIVQCLVGTGAFFLSLDKQNPVKYHSLSCIKAIETAICSVVAFL